VETTDLTYLLTYECWFEAAHFI